MTVSKVEPGKAPETIEIDGELKTLQKQVGGYIEGLPFYDDVAIICNEDGKVIGLPLNRAICDEDTDDMIEMKRTISNEVIKELIDMIDVLSSKDGYLQNESFSKDFMGCLSVLYISCIISKEQMNELVEYFYKRSK